MSTNPLVVLGAALLGAVIGAGSMLLLSPAPAPGPTLDTAALEKAFAKAIRDLDARMESRARRSEPVVVRPNPSVEDATTGGRSTPSVVAITAPAVAPAAAVVPVGSSAPLARRDRVAEIENWTGDVSNRRKWLFASEAEVLAHFGSPDSITTGGQEIWIYWTVEFDKIVKNHMITFSKGRVVAFGNYPISPRNAPPGFE